MNQSVLQSIAPFSPDRQAFAQIAGRTPLLSSTLSFRPLLDLPQLSCPVWRVELNLRPRLILFDHSYPAVAVLP
jgi:hypothetical protein